MKHFEPASESAERALEQRRARAVELEQALIDALPAAAISPVALLSAFTVGAVIGAAHRAPMPEAPASVDGAHERVRDGSVDFKWIAALPTALSLWRALQGISESAHRDPASHV